MVTMIDGRLFVFRVWIFERQGVGNVSAAIHAAAEVGVLDLGNGGEPIGTFSSVGHGAVNDVEVAELVDAVFSDQGNEMF